MNDEPALQGQPLEQKIAELVFPHVTPETIKAKIKEIQYLTIPGSTVTICHITLKNGYSVRGESACVDPRNYDPDIGRGVAYKDALSKIWPLEGYLLAEERWMQQELMKEAEELPGGHR